MKSGKVEYKNLSGIVRSLDQCPPTSFRTLTNLTVDERMGALVNRLGWRALQNSSGGDFIPSITPDGFIQNDFDYFQTTLLIGGGNSVFTRPSLIGGISQDVEMNLVDRFFYATGTTQVAIQSVSSATVDTIIINCAHPLGNNWFLGTIILDNTIGNSYAVVTSVLPSTGNAVLMLNKVTGWSAGDSITIYNSELSAIHDGFSYANLTNPHFVNVGGTNNIAICGTASNGKSLWVGIIENQSYFNGAFSFNGLYCTGFFDNFESGAFASTGQNNIQIKVQDATNVNTLISVVTPNPASPDPPTGWSITGGETTVAATFAHNDSSHYITATINSAYYGFGVGLDLIFASFSGALDPNGVTQVTVMAKSNALGNDMEVTIGSVNGTPVSQDNPQPIATSFTTYSFIFKNSDLIQNSFLDLNAPEVFILFGRYSGDTISVANVTLNIGNAITTIQQISVGAGNYYVLSFSVQLDGFEETELIYPKNFGVVNTGSLQTTYIDSNTIYLPPPPSGSDTTKVITVKVFTSKAELLNRRVTAINVYGAIIGELPSSLNPDELVWRYCNQIGINDPSWKFDGTNYYFELAVGNEINSGAIYASRLQAYASDSVEEQFKYAVTCNQRLFAVNDTDTQTVYYSSIDDTGYRFCVLPSANAILCNTILGAIVGLASVNGKIVVFKRYSTSILNVQNLPSFAQEVIISSGEGLASFRSIAYNEKSCFYVSYSGINQCDGFKIQRINEAWQEDFRNYTFTQLQGAVGFYDPLQSEYNCFIPTYAVDGVTVIGGDHWVYGVNSGSWHQSDLTHTVGSNQTYGLPLLASRTDDGRVLLYGKSGEAVREFPRTDSLLYTDRFAGSEYGTKLSLETNDAEVNEDEIYYLNDFTFKGENLANATSTTTSLQRNDVGVITNLKTITRQLANKLVVPCTTRIPTDKFSVAMTIQGSNSPALAGGKIVLREWSVSIRAGKRIGSIRTPA